MSTDADRLGEVPGYEVLRSLGHGAMGEVFLARHRELGREVALKRLLGDLENESLHTRFQREARIMHRIRHPNRPTGSIDDRAHGFCISRSGRSSRNGQ